MKIAIVLFNLGGPDSPEAVQPFLRNLFSAGSSEEERPPPRPRASEPRSSGGPN